MQIERHGLGSGHERKSGAAAVTELALDASPEADQRAAALAASLRSSPNDSFLRAVVGRDFKIQYRSVASLLAEPIDPPADLDPDEVDGEPTWSLLLRTVHLAFAAHLPLSLSPDVLVRDRPRDRRARPA